MLKKTFKIKHLTQENLLSEFNLFLDTLNNHDKIKFQKALDLVLKIHKDQKSRPDGEYINHILRVALRCIYFGITKVDTIISALLHDSVEDQKINLCNESGLFKEVDLLFLPDTELRIMCLHAIKNMFGESVSKNVDLLTNPEIVDDSTVGDFNKIYLNHVSNVVKNNFQAGIIKLSDFYDNGMDLDNIVDENRKNKYIKRYTPLFKVFKDQILVWQKQEILSNNIIDIINSDINDSELVLSL